MAKPQQLFYAGFWRRLHASVCDCVLVGVPWWFAFDYSLRASREVFIANSVGSPILVAGLELFLLARFGGTPGKLLVGIRVVQLDGAALTWKHAVLRNSVDLLYTLCGVGTILAIQDWIDYNLIGSLTATQLKDYWARVYPWWSFWLRSLNFTYGLSEAVVMLTNERRRAIHDFIAGTVVILKSPRKPVKKHRSAMRHRHHRES